VPVVLFGSEYWKRVLNLSVLVEEGVISPEDLNLFQFIDDVDEAWRFIQGFYKP
jgi:predicted Rossmann-fold nucleotide-binding protein